DLRAEGGHRVSARRENNAATWLRIVAGSDGPIVVRDNFGGRAPTWSQPGVRKAGENYYIPLKAGQAIEATLPKPDRIPPAPADLAAPVVIAKPSVIQATKLPLRIGADSQGNNRFQGDMARAAVFGRPLTAAEIKALADRQKGKPESVKGCIVALDLATRDAKGFANLGIAKLRAKAVGEVSIVEDVDGLSGKALRLDGKGYLEIAHDKALDCRGGLTLAVWVRPTALPPLGVRLIDKSPVGIAAGYLLDTYPSHSLRMITRDPWVGFDAKLPVGKWSHVAATVDGESGHTALYVNGAQVKEARR
ncbi:hypothetical protein HQ560_00065, partial [bacterium]|nr:hypothetical protein [bacterium]